MADSPTPGAASGPPTERLAALDSALARLGALPGPEVVPAARSDQAARWRAGQRVPAEAYLAALPALAGGSEDAQVLICGEALLRAELGEPPDLAEYQRRFPDLADQLALQFGLLDVLGDDTPATGPTAAEASPPDLSAYEILGELGRGGVGVVYKARDVRLNRIVALKVLLAGSLAGREQAERFRREAEAVARLQHPNVVQVFDVGAHEGRPFLVLEYVDGPTLARKCGGAPQPPAEAARLTETLARAVHEAHRLGVVHRDLKPANVLLTADGVPKVTDFGFAKAPDGGAGLTATGAVFGTPGYMAPEQAKGETKGAGAAADVYALGAILYDLLTGRPPFEGASVLEVLRKTEAEEPTPPRRLRPAVPRELEVICLKCLEKSPARRYASAADLAEDLRRFQAGEPIRARPVGAAGRTWRLCRRHPAAAAFVLALLGGTAGSLYFAIQERQQATLTLAQKQQAEASARRAEASLEVADQALAEMTSLTLQDLLDQQPELTEEHKMYLRRVLALYEKLAEGTAEDEKMRYRIAHVFRCVGDVRHRLGQLREAETAYDAALARAARLAEEFPENSAYRAEWARDHNHLGLVLVSLNRRDQAYDAFRRARDLQEELADEFPARREYRRELAITYSNLAGVLTETGRLTDAGPVYQKALALQEQLAAEDRSEPEDRAHLARTLNNLGTLAKRLNRSDEALDHYRRALALREKLAADFPKFHPYRRDRATGLFNLAGQLRRINRPDDALAAYRQAEGLFARLAADFPSVPQYRQQWAHTLINQSVVLKARNQDDDAVAAYRQALTILEKLAGDFPDVPSYRREWATNLNDLGLELAKLRRPDEAEAAYLQARTVREGLAADFPKELAYQIDLGGSYCNHGILVRDRPDPAGSLEWFSRAIALLEPADVPGPYRATAREYLRNSHWGRAIALTRLKRYAEALPDWDRAIDLDTGKSRYEMRLQRAQVLARLKQHARAAAEAGELAKMPDSKAANLYGLARVFALAAAAVPDDGRLADEYAARAVELLRRAADKDAKALVWPKKDPDFDALRRHEDFRKLLSDGAKNPPGDGR